MYNAFIIHGAFSSPGSNWFPWLKGELDGLGIETTVPEFPTGDKQSLSSWMATFEKQIDRICDKTLLIGHSLGPAFILAVLEKLDVRIPAAFMVAPFFEPIGIEKFDKVNDTFLNRSFDWDRIRKNCGEFYVYASDNDPYVPLEISKRAARDLGAELRLVPGAGHINSGLGYLRFERLLDDIRAVTASFRPI